MRLASGEACEHVEDLIDAGRFDEVSVESASLVH
jgi:TATA-binding protein-associated factor Taf7